MSELGALGYALSGALYAILAVLLLANWRNRVVGGYLIAACLISVAWGAILAMQTSSGLPHPRVLLSAELVRTGAWITFLVRLLKEIGASRLLRYAAHAVWLVSLVGGLVWASYLNPGVDSEGIIHQVMVPGSLATATVALLLTEQLYRNSAPESRSSLKWLVLGLGGMFAYDLFLYSQTVLLNSIDQATWFARGPINVFFVPLIGIAAHRNRTWNIRIFVSRQVVFYSTTLIAVGLYLLLMSAGGYLIMRVGGNWGALARIVFFAGAIVVLLTLLFSSRLRARAKVFLSKHFFRNKYDYRDEWLRLVATLARFNDSSTRQVVVEAIAQIVGSPSGLLWVKDEKIKSYRPAASYHTDEDAPDLRSDDSIVRFISDTGWLVDLEEFSRQPDRYGDLELPTWLQEMPRAWLIVPLISGGELFGLVLLDRAPGPLSLNYEDRDLLKTVGNHIAVHLAQERSDILLAESQQFEAYNKLTAFLMHDLNNLIAQQSLIVSNAEKHKRNPEFVDDAIRTISNSVDRMKNVMAQLRRAEVTKQSKSTPVKFIVSGAVDRCAGRLPIPSIELDGGEVELAVDTEEFTMVLAHLIRNAQDATAADGSIGVRLDANERHIRITIADTGSGMAPQFVRERLFRPFDSTKGAQGMGIGAYQAREFARKLGGDLAVVSELGKGTTMTLSLPRGRGA